MRVFSILTYIISVVFIAYNSSLAAPPTTLLEAKNTYCETPPFLQEETYANVMLVIDSSGSMRADAYTGTYNGNEIYKGLFKYNAYYACWDELRKRYVTYSAASCTGPYRYWRIVVDNEPPPYKKRVRVGNKYLFSGNYLNYEYMKRVDVIRWVLTGGRETLTWIRKQRIVTLYYGQNILYTHVTSYNPDTKQVEGILQKTQRLKKRPRIGAYFFQNRYITRRVKPSYDYTSLIWAINTKSMSGSTPTKYALEDTRKYFSRKSGSRGGFRVGRSDYVDPYVFNVNGKKITVSCAKNFAILLTDGEWNTGGDPIGEAYNMWKGGTADLVSNLKGNQNAKLYSIALFLEEGAGKNAVQHLAIFGGYENRDGNNWPCAYTGYKTPSYNQVRNCVIYGLNDPRCRINCNSSTIPSSICPIKDITKPANKSCRDEWDADLDALPDTYASGDDPQTVKEALEKVFRRILSEVASGSSVSMLSEKDKAGAILAQAVFYPQKTFTDGSQEYKLKWIGQLFSYWFLNTENAQNIREDTVRDNKLSITDDKILQFNISTTTGKLRIDICPSDSDGNPTGSCTFTDRLEDIKYLWEAGEKLKARKPSTRKLYTVSRGNTLVEFTTNNLSRFKFFLGTNSRLFPDCLVQGAGNINYKGLVNYVRGEDIPGCRKRVVDKSGNTWKLADIIYSTPKVVTYGNDSVIFTASNDGILHAFKVGSLQKPSSDTYVAELTGTDLGEELWGFIPKSALPYLRFLADPDYCHMYMHDLSPFIFEADYDNDGANELVLIGGMRLAGGCINSDVNPPKDTCPNLGECFGLSAYYALDITNPTAPKFLWEFTDKDLGFSFSGPAIVSRQDVTGNWEYYVIFASGPTDYRGFSNQNLHIFILYLQDGNLIAKKNMGSEFRNSFGGRLFTEGLDVNGDGQTDFVFLGYARKAGKSSPWEGGIIKIWTGDADPANWDFNTTMLNFAGRPITSRVEFGKCFGKWYLYFGTGRYFFKEDELSQKSALYGVPFLCDENNNCPTGTINPVNSATSSISCNKVGDPTQGAWMIELEGAVSGYLTERNISDPSSLQDIVFFVTSQPTADVCGYGGRSRAWALNCALGESLASTRCSGYTIQNTQFKLIVQRSGGDIKAYGASNFTERGGRATSFSEGIAPEEGGLPITPFSGSGGSGTILLWIEK